MASDSSLQRYQAELTVAPDSAGTDLLSVFLQRFDRKQTRRAYKNDISQFFKSDYVLLDDVKHLSFVHFNQYIAGLEAAGLKSTTIKRRIAALRGFFDWLVALELVDSNPVNRQLVRRVRTVRRQDQAIVVLTSQQAEALLDVTTQSGQAAVRDRTLMTTMLHCVLRRSEAAAMDVEHIRPLGRYWVLDLPHTKGGADQYVKVPTHVVDEIELMKSHYGITSGPLWRSFSHRNAGTRLTPHSIYRIIKQAAIRAGLSESIGAHTLRHSGCTLAIEAGASLQQVQAHARHKNLETTMVYIHQRDRLRDSAADYIHIKKL